MHFGACRQSRILWRLSRCTRSRSTIHTVMPIASVDRGGDNTRHNISHRPRPLRRSQSKAGGVLGNKQRSPKPLARLLPLSPHPAAGRRRPMCLLPTAPDGQHLANAFPWERATLPILKRCIRSVSTLQERQKSYIKTDLDVAEINAIRHPTSEASVSVP